MVSFFFFFRNYERKKTNKKKEFSKHDRNRLASQTRLTGFSSSQSALVTIIIVSGDKEWLKSNKSFSKRIDVYTFLKLNLVFPPSHHSTADKQEAKYSALLNLTHQQSEDRIHYIRNALPILYGKRPLT